MLDTGLVTMGGLGTLVAVLSWLGHRQTKGILEAQRQILARQAEILAQMEANALARPST